MSLGRLVKHESRTLSKIMKTMSKGHSRKWNRLPRANDELRVSKSFTTNQYIIQQIFWRPNTNILKFLVHTDTLKQKQKQKNLIHHLSWLLAKQLTTLKTDKEPSIYQAFLEWVCILG